MMGSRVFIGNLDWKISSHDLKVHMGQVGEVMFAKVFEDTNGRSRGNGIVEYKTPEEAQAAIAELNDTTLGERLIFVREDREGGKKGGKGGFGKGKDEYGKGSFRKGDSDAGGCGGKSGGYGKGKGKDKGTQLSGSFGYGQQDNGRVVYVGNLPYRTGWQDLKDLFQPHGEVIRVEVAQDMDGRSKGYATVLFERGEDAQSAIAALNEEEFQGRSMKLRMFNIQ